jgi:adenylate cyclase
LRAKLWRESDTVRAECDSIEWALVRSRQRSERVIGWTGVAVAVLVMPSVLYRMQSTGTGASKFIAALIVGIFLWYLSVAISARLRVPTLALQLINTHLEIGLPVVIMLADSLISPTWALLGAASTALGLGVVVSTLRLRPVLSLYAGAAAAASQLLVYFYVIGDTTPTLDVLHPSLFTSRAALLLCMGVTCWVASRALRRLQETVVQEASERARVRAAFGAYVAEQVVDRILSGDLTLRTERREVSVVFVDIRGFTSYAEGRDPEEVVASLNIALDAFCRAVQEQDGIVNKFLGDGLMALFGAPQEQDDHALRAVKAGFAMVQHAKALRDSGVMASLRIGVGVHTGEVVVGDIGSEAHREYTAIGDVVNVAARLEETTKMLDTAMLISGEVADRLPAGTAELREHSPMTLRGRVGALRLSEVVSIDSDS